MFLAVPPHTNKHRFTHQPKPHLFLFFVSLFLFFLFFLHQQWKSEERWDTDWKEFSRVLLTELREQQAALEQNDGASAVDLALAAVAKRLSDSAASAASAVDADNALDTCSEVPVHSNDDGSVVVNYDDAVRQKDIFTAVLTELEEAGKELQAGLTELGEDGGDASSSSAVPEVVDEETAALLQQVRLFSLDPHCPVLSFSVVHLQRVLHMMISFCCTTLFTRLVAEASRRGGVMSVCKRGNDSDAFLFVCLFCRRNAPYYSIPDSLFLASTHPFIIYHIF